eukprot:4286528-Pyramimonas_sp.AAC.1
MLHRTELFGVFILAQCNITALILCVPHSTNGICTLEFALTERVLDALDALVSGVLSAGHINIINMSGCEQ